MVAIEELSKGPRNLLGCQFELDVKIRPEALTLGNGMTGVMILRSAGLLMRVPGMSARVEQ